MRQTPDVQAGRPTIRNQDRLHAGSRSRLDARAGVLEDDAIDRAMPESLGSHQKDVRLRLTSADLVTPNHDFEMVCDAGLTKETHRNVGRS
jgi:hypothetical protein